VKQFISVVCMTIFSAALIAGCSEEAPAPKAQTEKPSAQTMPATQDTQAPQAAPSKRGTVLETMDASGYTYVQVDTGAEKIWAAAPQFEVKVGDDVVIPEGMPMPNYHSKTLDRDFDVVYFVPSVLVGGSTAAGDGSGHPMMTGNGPVAEAATDIDFSDLKPAEGGQTISELYGQKAALGGKQVKVRGKVVKVNSGIMGKNWLHIQDGTGTEGGNDLTVTTAATAETGDTVVISGMLTLDKDIGSGYQFDVIVEDAEVTVEK